MVKTYYPAILINQCTPERTKTFVLVARSQKRCLPVFNFQGCVHCILERIILQSKNFFNLARTFEPG
jgi:hypothetical protein